MPYFRKISLSRAPTLPVAAEFISHHSARYSVLAPKLITSSRDAASRIVSCAAVVLPPPSGAPRKCNKIFTQLRRIFRPVRLRKFLYYGHPAIVQRPPVAAGSIPSCPSLCAMGAERAGVNYFLAGDAVSRPEWRDGESNETGQNGTTS